MKGTTSTLSRCFFPRRGHNKAPSSDLKGSTAGRIPIYTDGSYFFQSEEAGYGVYYPDGSHSNALVHIYSRDATPQLVELMGIKHAMIDVANELHQEKSKLPSSERYYEIRTDSTYVIHWITTLYANWCLYGRLQPQRGQGGRHLRLIFDIVEIYNFINVEYHKAGQSFMKLVHVKAHVGEEGNEVADTLAKRGALRS